MKLLASLVSVTALLFALHAVTAFSYSADKCSFAAVNGGQGQSADLRRDRGVSKRRHSVGNKRAVNGFVHIISVVIFEKGVIIKF